MTESTVIAANEANEVNDLVNGISPEAQAAKDAEKANKEAKEAEEAEEEAEIWDRTKYTNEALDKLRDEAESVNQKAQTFKFGSKGYMQAFEAIQKLTGQIRSEIQGIKKQAILAAQKAKEAAITSQLQELCNKFRVIGRNEASGQPQEVIDGQNEEAMSQFDTVLNMLLGNKATTAKEATTATNGTTSAPAHGSVRAEIENMFIDLTAKGLNRTEAVKAIKEAGFARGSANTYVKEYLERTGQA